MGASLPHTIHRAAAGSRCWKWAHAQNGVDAAKLFSELGLPEGIKRWWGALDIFQCSGSGYTLLFSWAGGDSAILRGTGKKILFSFAHSSCILRIVLLWDAPPERAQWWWCQGTSASKKQTNWNRGNLDAQKIRQESWLDYPLVARPILAHNSEYKLISKDLLLWN